MRLTSFLLACGLAATLAVSAAAPAAAQIREDRLEELATTAHGIPGPPRRGCRVLREPGTLPAVSALADSAAFAAALAEFAARYPLRDDSVAHATYSVTVDRTGHVERFRPLGWMLPLGRDGELEQLVRRHLHPEGVGAGTVRLVLRLTAVPTVTVERSQLCPAEVRTRFELRNYAVQGRPMRPQPLRVRVQVAANGQIQSVQLLGTTGSQDVDRWVQETLQRSGAMPAIIDGEPVQTEVEPIIQVETR